MKVRIFNWLGRPQNIKIFENECGIQNQCIKRQQDQSMEKKKCDIKCKNGHPSKHALRKRADTYIQGDSGCLFLIALAYTKCREIYVHGINCEVNARTFVKINFLSISRVFLGKDARDNICNCFDSLYVEAFFTTYQETVS